ncbi:MAG: hypothetical protein OSB05_15650 [Akkermansiaceae bacterium]|nr:hypothetical protein [Akkermansiaceae bacterium]
METFTPIYAAAFIATAFFVSMILTRIFIVVGPRLGLMDEPDERRVHQVPIPRAGGIAIWLSYLIIAWGGALVFPHLSGIISYQGLVAFTASSSLLMVVGFIDDRQGMRALLKLGGQLAAALLYFSLDPSLWGMSILGYDLPLVISCIIFTGWCVLLINAFNLIDGLDGLCSGLVLVSLFVIAGLEFVNGRGSTAVMVLTMAAAVGGFMRFNLNPAKIFLGDAGSMMLGFFLATSATQIGGEKAVIGSIMLPIAIAGVPLLDVLLAVWRRSARGHLQKSHGEEQSGGIFTADKDHLHHRFLALGLTQRKVAYVLQGLAVLLATLCFVPLIMGGRGLVITLCGFVVLGLFGIRHFARVELLQTGSLLHLAVKRRNKRRGLRSFYYAYDIVALTSAGFLAMVIETNFGARNELGVWSVNYLLLFVIVQVGSLQVLRIYRRVWSRPAIREFFLVAVGLTVGGLIASSIWAATNDDVTWSDFRCGFIGAQLAIWLVLLPRAIPEVVRELAVDSKHRKLTKSRDGEKQVLVYGAGKMGNLFVDYLKNSAPAEFEKFKISGFLDENENLKNRMLQGFQIHGGLDCIEDLKGKYPLHGILVAISDMPEEGMQRVFEVASQSDLKVYQWQADLTPLESPLGESP